MDFPTKIDEISKRIPPSWGISEEFLIHHCTFFPLYRHFMDEEFAREIMDMMCSRKEGLILNKLGLRLHRDNGIYYCVECSKDDISKYGETYIRRLHQVPGVMVCPNHGTLLKKVDRNPKKQELRFITHHDVEEAVLPEMTPGEKEIILLKEISSDVARLLSSETVVNEKVNLVEKYKILLKHRGYTLRTGKLKAKKLLSDFVDFYGAHILELFDLPISVSKSHWLFKMLYGNHKNLFPIRHVLLMRFLSGSVDSFIKADVTEITEEPPFGNGPWYCLNPAASHYKERVVGKVEIHHKTSEITSGTFICDCGFIYTRIGPFKNEEDEMKKGIVKQYGPVWENKLRQFIRERRTLKYMREELGISQDALKSAIAKLDKRDKGETKTFSKKEKREKYRARIENILATKSDVSLREVIGEYSHTYLWLQQHDKEWLEKIVSSIKKGHSKKSKDEEDKQVFEKAAVLIKDWDKNGNRPIRITKKQICELLDLSERYVSALPKTNNFIKGVLETKADYLVRLVDWIVVEMEKDGGRDIKEEDIYGEIPVKYPQKWLVEYVRSKMVSDAFRVPWK